MTGATIEKSAGERSTRAQLRYQAVAWFGIIGAAATLMGHLRGVLAFAQVSEFPVLSWITLLTDIWRNVLFILPQITRTDAVLLSLFSFVVLNSINASFRPRARLPFAPILFVIAVLMLACIFLIGALDLTGPDSSGLYHSYTTSPPVQMVFHLVEPYLDPRTNPSSSWRFFHAAGAMAVVFILVFLVPLTTATIAIVILDYAFGVRFNLAAFTVRIWKMHYCLLALVGLNYLALWWEHGFATPPSFVDPLFSW